MNATRPIEGLLETPERVGLDAVDLFLAAERLLRI
jgi:hypothetical protein